MVCLGNICRSPIAEGVLQHKIMQHGLLWTVDSAGTQSYHIGEAPHPFSQKVCLRNGIDITAQRARQFELADFERFDKIYAMADDVYANIREIGEGKADMGKVDFFLNELKESCNASVPDPWFGDEKMYTPVYDLINRTCEAIIEKYKR